MGRTVAYVRMGVYALSVILLIWAASHLWTPQQVLLPPFDIHESVTRSERKAYESLLDEEAVRTPLLSSQAHPKSTPESTDDDSNQGRDPTWDKFTRNTERLPHVVRGLMAGSFSEAVCFRNRNLNPGDRLIPPSERSQLSSELRPLLTKARKLLQLSKETREKELAYLIAADQLQPDLDFINPAPEDVRKARKLRSFLLRKTRQSRMPERIKKRVRERFADIGEDPTSLCRELLFRPGMVYAFRPEGRYGVEVRRLPMTSSIESYVTHTAMGIGGCILNYFIRIQTLDSPRADVLAADLEKHL